MIISIVGERYRAVCETGPGEPLRTGGREVYCGSTLVAQCPTSEEARGVIDQLVAAMVAGARMVDVINGVVRPPGATLPTDTRSRQRLAQRLVDGGVYLDDGRRLGWTMAPLEGRAADLGALAEREQGGQG